MSSMIANATAGVGIPARIEGLIEGIKQRVAMHRRFNQTYTELNNLSDRELADLGMCRANIREIALQAAQDA